MKKLSIICLAVILLSACAPTAPALPATDAVQAPTVEQEQPTTAPVTVSTEAATLEPVKLTVALYPYMTEAPYFIAQDEGYFAEQGLTIEFVRYEKSSDVIPALAQGQLDISTVLVGASTINTIAHGEDVRIVAGKGYLDPTACGYTGWAVSNAMITSGRLDDLEQLRGLKVATEPATLSEFALDKLLAQANLTLADVSVENLPITSRQEALQNGAIDIAGASEPWIIRMTNSNTIKLWKSFSSYLPNLQWGLVAFGPTLVKDNPDVGNRFMIAFLKGVRKYNEGKTDRNVEIIAKYTQLSPEEVRASCWQTMTGDGSINAQSIVDFEDWALSNEYIDQVVPEETFWDSRFVDFANNALK